MRVLSIPTFMLMWAFLYMKSHRQSNCRKAEDKPESLVSGQVGTPIYHDNLIRAEQTSLLYHASITSILTAMILAIAMVYVQWGVVDRILVSSWFVSTSCVYSLRGILSIAYFRVQPLPESSELWMKLFLIGTLLAGILWGVGAWILYPQGQEVHQAFQGVLFAGLAAGAVTSLSASRLAVISFLVLSVIPLVIRFLSEDSEIFRVLGVLIVLFILVSGVGVYRINSNILQNIRLRLEANARESALQQSEHKYRSLMEHSPLSIQEVSPEGKILRVNSAWEQLWGVPFSALENYNMLQDKELVKQGIMPLIQRVFAGEAMEIPAYEYNKGNDPELLGQSGQLWVRTFLYPLLCEGGKVREIVLIQEDVSERKKQEEHILYQAHFDTLTDLPNRFLVLDRLSQLINDACRYQEKVAILFLDLDDFKKVNDTLGHETGDKLLQEAALRLKGGVRQGDTVGRLGGDEFIVLLGGIADAVDARPVAESLLAHFRDPFRVDQRELILTASIGIAIYPGDGDSPSELLRNADSAMYHSKDQGRNTYFFFTDEMNQGVSRRLHLEEQMYGALNRGEFRLYYQPKVELASRKIVGVEALLRWQNPVLDDVAPIEFVPIAEHTGLIVSIGEFVLTEALSVVAFWQRKLGRLITMSVNLSPRQFRNPNLVSFIEDALCQSGLSGQCLELEITEGVLMSGHTYIDDALTALSELGISIAMDDFGTGYSSLSYLRSFPFDVLKIDREFVNDITVDPGDRELVNAAIAMAHGLGLKVVAEGVETEEQLALLASQDCDYGQGYLFSKPICTAEMTKMLEAESDVNPLRRRLSV